VVQPLVNHADAAIPTPSTRAFTSAIEDLKSVLEGEDAEAISAKTQVLAQASMKLGEAMYAAQQGGEGDSESSSPDDVVDAEFEEVNEDGKKA
jgi:molecular chaperone DnaK